MMNDKLRYRVRKTMVFLLLFFVTFLCIGRVSAKTESERSEEEILEEINSWRDTIVHIESICWNGENDVYQTKAFTGFVVSKDSSGIYIVTVNDGLTFSSNEKEAIRAEYELEDNVRVSEKIEAVFSGDLRIPASIVGESKQRNLSVLKLSQTINFEHTVLFPDNDTFHKERVFLLSYPEQKEKKIVYNSENVKVTSGTITGAYVSEEITFLQHNIKTDAHSVGGPLLNENGLLSGLLLTSTGKKAGTAISADSLKGFLDTFNVSYTEYEEEIIVKKLPILNIVLGFVIAGLLAAVIMQSRKEVYSIKRRKNQNGKYDSKTVKEETRNSLKYPQPKATVNINARLEYPAEKRMAIIGKAVFIIGRTQDADFILADSSGISRKHACIQFDGKYFYLSDLKSTNHTYLNSIELSPGEKKVLKNGDEVIVGKEKLYFRLG